MARTLAVLAFCLVAGVRPAVADTAKAGVTPITKVLGMLEEMVAKGIKAKQDEETKFAAFSTWCSGTQDRKKAEVTEGTDLMGMLEAKIAKSASHIAKLTDRILELEEDVGRWKKDEKSATSVRDMEKSDYLATVADYMESLDALTGAIGVLKKQAFDRSQADSLLQLQSQRLVPPSVKRALASFLQQQDSLSLALPEAPEANAYEFQSGGVIAMLEKLKGEFSAKKTDLDKEELAAQQGFEQIVQQLADNIENAEHEISKKTTSRAETGQVKSEAEGDLASATKERDEDQKYLDDTVTLCTSKSKDYEKRQELRAGEIDALKKAIEIIGGSAVKGSGEKHLPQLLQLRQKTPVTLAQLRNGNGDFNPLQERVAAFLGDRAVASNSRLLSLVSQRVAADPFSKVKKMIKDLIVKLMEEATSETEHKGWCDTELTTNKQTRDAKSASVAKLTSEAEDLTATIAGLAADIEKLTKEVAELDAAMTTASEERSKSKADNTETISDAKEGQLAVTEAISVLKDFYAKSAEATSLTQQSPGEDAPETFDKPYTGMMPEGGSVVDFLEVILSDFARLESETTTAEASEQEDYEKYMFESKKDKALKENEKAHKDETKVNKESELHSTQAELKVTQEQLDKALEYYEKLKPTCVDSGITYEDRVKRREEEIVSLQEALKILAGSDIA